MIHDTEKVVKSTCLRTNKAKSLWTSRARYRTRWLEQFLYSPTLFLRLQSHSGKSRPSLLLMWNCSWLKSVTKYWHGCLKVQAGSEVCHCVKETRLVSKIWAPLSPIFYLHWAWMWLKGFPSLELAPVILHRCAGKVQGSLTDGPEHLKSKQEMNPNNKTLLLNLEDNFPI